MGWGRKGERIYCVTSSCLMWFEKKEEERGVICVLYIWSLKKSCKIIGYYLCKLIIFQNVDCFALITLVQHVQKLSKNE